MSVTHPFVCEVADDAASAAAGKVLPSHWNQPHLDGVPGYQPNQVLTGGGVAWVSGLTFDVAATTYVIQGTTYATAQTQKTLSNAHATLNRIDVIAVDNTNTVVVVEGTAAANPVKPDIDDASQLELTFVYVPAASSTPTITTVDIYHENTEWTSSKSGAPINLASTSNPHAGTVDVEGTAATLNNHFQFQAPAPIDLATYNGGSLIFYIRSKAAWPATRSIAIRWQSAGVQKGSIVSLREGAFGFNSASTSSYQLIVIPLSLFGANGLSVNQLRFTVAGTGATIGFYFDDCIIQGTVIPTTPPAGVTSVNGRSGAVTIVSSDMTDVATSRLIGRTTAGTGASEQLPIGTGVATALAVNTGSAGAMVVNGGVLGTPASGDLRNCTGYPAAQGGALARLAQVVTTGSQANVDFQNISNAYSTLLLYWIGRDTHSGTSVNSMFLKVNNDGTAANYSSSGRIFGIGAVVGSGVISSSTSGVCVGGLPDDGNTAGIAAAGCIEIVGYAQTTFHKRILAKYGSDDATNANINQIYEARWANTAAITRLTFSTAGTAFKDGSIFTLYGVA